MEGTVAGRGVREGDLGAVLRERGEGQVERMRRHEEKRHQRAGLAEGKGKDGRPGRIHQVGDGHVQGHVDEGEERDVQVLQGGLRQRLPPAADRGDIGEAVRGAREEPGHEEDRDLRADQRGLREQRRADAVLQGGSRDRVHREGDLAGRVRRPHGRRVWSGHRGRGALGALGIGPAP